MENKDSLNKQQLQIASLKHENNAFSSPAYLFSSFPLVLEHITDQLDSLGFAFTTAKYPEITKDKFELQTHECSVDEHTDAVDSKEYFAIYPVKSVIKVQNRDDTRTEFNYTCLNGKIKTNLEVGKLLVFNPRKKHSLIYYGEATTFMLFSVCRHYKAHKREPNII